MDRDSGDECLDEEYRSGCGYVTGSTNGRSGGE